MTNHLVERISCRLFFFALVSDCETAEVTLKDFNSGSSISIPQPPSSINKPSSHIRRQLARVSSEQSLTSNDSTN
jgi:hypothetical protein